MKKPFFKWLALTGVSLILIFLTVGFGLAEPKADLEVVKPLAGKSIFLNEIVSTNEENGAFKTAVNFKSPVFDDDTNRAFYGQRLRIVGNPNVDRIDIGITSNMISRVELWKAEKLVEVKELGFMDKMTWGDTHRLSVEMVDENHSRSNGKSSVKMRFTKGSGFFGDIGTIGIDLSSYGSFTGSKAVEIFQKPVEEGAVIAQGEFSHLKIWKNFTTAD